MRTQTVILATIVALCLSTAAQAKYSGGTGEPNDPYRIATAEDLNDIANHVEDFNKCFLMVADINLADYTGTQFNIIGIDTTEFTGVFDGNDHKIWSFTRIGIPPWEHIELFGYVGESGQIKNLGLEKADLNDGGLIIAELVRGNYGSISNCYSTSSVSGDAYMGGFIEYNHGTITNCYSTDGLVGENSGTITNCYSSGSACGGEWACGGLVGENSGTITNCYSTGSVTGDFCEHVGGLVGYSYYGSVTTSFWDVNTSGQSTSDGGEGLPTAQMKTESTFTDAGWDFVDIWDICEGTNYPKFVWQIPLGDLICPDGVNFIDYSFFAGHWMDVNCSDSNDCDGCDFDFSDMVDANDLQIFCDHWLEGG